ncbi:trypsin-like peptidase domain-containing protein [Bacillus sp. AK130]|nr:trypsin-like peptidase domain-containing protein [Bacillus paralicheniformis]MCY7862059.1 trypsin-like peptidase domain-containing protein [Bacillus haynesii]MCY8340738.1 trypsin-like peptidase domain-containing protein [Bacillus haynesii]MCY9150899.1 trypsin-like peptidase domain-containing protein [Bacillus haynesii]
MVEFNHDEEKFVREKPVRNWRSFLFSSLIGAVIGALLTVFALPYLSQQGWLPYNLQVIEARGGQGTQQGGTVRNVSVNVNNEVTQVVSKVSDSVVGVINIQKTGVWDGDSEAGTGSGVIYKKDGNTSHIVTNHHVIEGASQIEVSLNDGTRIPAKLIGSDKLMDLAVLQVNSNKIKAAAEFGNSDKVKTGEPVIAIGNPLGLQFSGSVTQGIISGTERAVPVDSNGDGQPDWNAEVLQTDAAINPGNSGGGLFNIDGKVIGINSMKIAESAVEGIGLSIPANLAIPVIEDLETYGEVRRPYLGIEMKSLGDIASYHWQETLKLPKNVTSGVVVMGVQPVSPAGRAGLKELDVIVEFNGDRVYDIVDLRKKLYTKNVGDKVKIKYLRGGKEKTTEVKLTRSQLGS